MNSTQEKTLFHLTGKENLSEVPVEELQALAAAHPYFAPAQFLLASKLKLDHHTGANDQVAKTALYFDNPLWLQYQLNLEPCKEITASSSIIYQPSAISNKDLPDPEEVEDEEAEVEDITPIEDTPIAGKISSLLSDHLADFKKPVEADAKLDIEAERERLHTIDYFASQGIKIDLTAIPQDRLTSQLRKFTDWLKQMKPPGTGASDLGTATDLENVVKLNAENSNEPREVVTETMAEVLEKQGQVEKAIQLYIKLSFLNPEKSAYFAAKIQQLKGI